MSPVLIVPRMDAGPSCQRSSAWPPSTGRQSWTLGLPNHRDASMPDPYIMFPTSGRPTEPVGLKHHIILAENVRPRVGKSPRQIWLSETLKFYSVDSLWHHSFELRIYMYRVAQVFYIFWNSWIRSTLFCGILEGTLPEKLLYSSVS